MIQVNHLSFSYTKQPFIQDMSFSVGSGEIFGFLGPSGAGKSTLQKILLGMLPNYQGSARVNRTECKHRGADFYESIGVDFEFSTMYEKLSAKENLQFFSSLYRRQARSIPELLAAVGLENDADKRVSDYSKGMKSRLNFVKALLHDPELLFLDEPTSGLDPTNSRLMKDIIKNHQPESVSACHRAGGNSGVPAGCFASVWGYPRFSQILSCQCVHGSDRRQSLFHHWANPHCGFDRSVVC